MGMTKLNCDQLIEGAEDCIITQIGDTFFDHDDTEDEEVTAALQFWDDLVKQRSNKSNRRATKKRRLDDDAITNNRPSKRVSVRKKALGNTAAKHLENECKNSKNLDHKGLVQAASDSNSMTKQTKLRVQNRPQKTKQPVSQHLKSNPISEQIDSKKFIPDETSLSPDYSSCTPLNLYNQHMNSYLVNPSSLPASHLQYASDGSLHSNCHNSAPITDQASKPQVQCSHETQEFSSLFHELDSYLSQISDYEYTEPALTSDKIYEWLPSDLKKMHNSETNCSTQTKCDQLEANVLASHKSCQVLLSKENELETHASDFNGSRRKGQAELKKSITWESSQLNSRQPPYYSVLIPQPELVNYPSSMYSYQDGSKTEESFLRQDYELSWCPWNYNPNLCSNQLSYGHQQCDKLDWDLAHYHNYDSTMPLYFIPQTSTFPRYWEHQSYHGNTFSSVVKQHYTIPTSPICEQSINEMPYASI